MTLKQIDYSKSVIYKIEHIDKPELLYIGSTTDFTRRKAGHKHDCFNEYRSKYNIKLYQMIRANGNWDSFKIMIIKEFPCNSKTELLIEEEKYRKELQASLNSCKCYITEEEEKELSKELLKKWRINNKEYANKENKKWRDKNKEQINNNNKNNRIICICGCEIRYDSRFKHEKTKKHINFINNNLEQFNDTFHCNDIFHCG